jgi:hypothetical protein
MQRAIACLVLVIIATSVALIDPRSFVSVLVCITPVFVELGIAGKPRDQSKDAEQAVNSIDK